MEIERKFLVSQIPENLNDYPCRIIEQGYLNTSPVVRVRRDNNDYYLTYKGKGLMVREEYNLPLTKEAYDHLISKADGNIITKKRYEIPDGSGHIIELDIFGSVYLRAQFLLKLNFLLLKKQIPILPFHGLPKTLLLTLHIKTAI